MSNAMPALALLAGGYGTRLGALTRDRPKSMVAVAGEPFIAHQLRLFRRRGIDRVVICAGHLSQSLVAFVEDGRAFGCTVEWSLDGGQPLGTGGAIMAALPLLGSRFLVCYGDSWLDTDYQAIVAAFEAHGQPALMTLFRNDGRGGTSNAAFSDGKLLRYDKHASDPGMRHIDYGLTMLESSVMAGWSSPFDLADLLSALAAAGRVAALEMTQRFYEIGSVAGLAETERLLGGSTA